MCVEQTVRGGGKYRYQVGGYFNNPNKDGYGLDYGGNSGSKEKGSDPGCFRGRVERL